MKYTTRIISIPRTVRIPAATLAGGVRRPQVIGPQKSFGFGDRLGLGAAGAVVAIQRQPGFMPVFAQQSPREMAQTGRTPQDVMQATAAALAKAHYRQSWGADADRLKTTEDAERAAAAGFTCFTLDPSDLINDDAELLSAAGLDQALVQLTADGDAPENWTRSYLDGEIELPRGQSLRFTPETLRRAVVKYSRALAHCERLAAVIARACPVRDYEIDLTVDGTARPTTPLEHLYLGLELEARRVRVVSFGPRFVGDFEPGADYRGDLAVFEETLRLHMAVAEFCGPYKLAFRGGAEPFSVYPVIARTCHDLVHVKTSGVSYLEALRVVLRANPALFGELIQFAAARFEIDRAAAPVSTTLDEVRRRAAAPAGDEERLFFGDRPGRQLLLVASGSTLQGGRDAQSRPFKDAILETLAANADLYKEVLAAAYVRQLAALTAG